MLSPFWASYGLMDWRRKDKKSTVIMVWRKPTWVRWLDLIDFEKRLPISFQCNKGLEANSAMYCTYIHIGFLYHQRFILLVVEKKLTLYSDFLNVSYPTLSWRWENNLVGEIRVERYVFRKTKKNHILSVLRIEISAMKMLRTCQVAKVPWAIRCRSYYISIKAALPKVDDASASFCTG